MTKSGAIVNMQRIGKLHSGVGIVEVYKRKE